MKGGIIYQPGGLAREYGKLGANLYNPGLTAGCRAGCRYCSNPHGPAVRARRSEVEARPFKPRKDVLERLLMDCGGKFRNCKTPVVMGFVGDIFQPHDEGDDVTLEALQIMSDHGLVPAVLTKFGTAACESFRFLQSAGGWFGQTCAWHTDWYQAERWEPHAAHVVNRVEANRMAFTAGVRTWWSVEPVLNVSQALNFVEFASAARFSTGAVDHIKLGKLNGYDTETRAIERSINWPSYREEARRILNAAGYREIQEPGAFEVGTYYVKRELREAL